MCAPAAAPSDSTVIRRSATLQALAVSFEFVRSVQLHRHHVAFWSLRQNTSSLCRRAVPSAVFVQLRGKGEVGACYKAVGIGIPLTRRLPAHGPPALARLDHFNCPARSKSLLQVPLEGPSSFSQRIARTVPESRQNVPGLERQSEPDPISRNCKIVRLAHEQRGVESSAAQRRGP